jgi:hypothetical protein
VNGDAVTGLTDGSFTKRISKNGAAFGAMTVTISEMENGWYSIPLSASHSDTLGLLTVVFTNAGAKQVNLQWRVEANILDDLATATNLATVDTVVDGIQTDLDNGTDGLGAIKGDTAAILTDTGTTLQAELDAIEAAVITNAAGADIAADIIAVKAETALIVADTNELQTDDIPGTIAALNDPTAAAIADAVWDEASAGHTDAGKAGQQLWTDVDAILADTNELQTDDIPGAITALNDPTAAAVADAVWDEAKAGHVGAGSFGEEVQAHALSTEISALNDISTAEVNTEVDTALADYDPPTKAELDSGFAALNDPTAASVADAVWDEAKAGHVGAGSFGEEVQAHALTTEVSALNDLSAADVNAEVVDVMRTDTVAEIAAVPAANAPLHSMIQWLFSLARNKRTTTATTDTLRNDADGADIASSTISDDGSTFTRGEYS